MKYLAMLRRAFFLITYGMWHGYQALNVYDQRGRITQVWAIRRDDNKGQLFWEEI